MLMVLVVMNRRICRHSSISAFYERLELIAAHAVYAVTSFVHTQMRIKHARCCFYLHDMISLLEWLMRT